MFSKSKNNESQEAFDISKFDSDEQDEIRKIQENLGSNEVVKAVARQSKFMPGGKMITPRTIIATDKRILIRNPSSLGLRADVDSIPYNQVNNVKLKKGAFTSALIIESGQYEKDEDGFIPAIPKKKAAQIYGIINEGLSQAQQNPGITQIVEQKQDDDPITILKKRFAKGEISKEDFEEMKSALE